jgi:urease accessory protein
MLETPTPTSPRANGRIQLIYQQRGKTTQPIQTYSQAPYKLQRPFYPQGKAICYTTLLHTAGGIVGGDQLSQSIQLQPNTQVVITTAAASKIYRSNGLTAHQKTEITVGADASLEYLPREMIVFENAQYRQHLRVNLAPTATWLGWEIVRFGRSARGEQFKQGDWRSGTEVWQDGQLIWVDRPWLPGGKEVWDSPHGLAGCPLVATLVWMGKPIPSEMMTQVRQLAQSIISAGETGATQLMSGLLCRYRGNSRAEVINWFINVWRLLRQWEGRISPVTPRVWQV